MRLVLLLFSACLIAASCAASPAPRAPSNPLMQGLTEPPPNLPRPIPTDLAEQVTRPEAREATAILWQDDAPFSGEVVAPAQVTTSDNLITIAARGARPVEVHYDLPDAMAPLRRYAGPANVVLREDTSPAGAERLLVVRAGAALLLSQVRLSDPAPLRIDLGAGLTLEQSATRTDRPGYTPVSVALLDGGRRVGELSTGEVRRLRTSSGEIQFYVEVSTYYAPQNDSEAQAPIYALNAWLSEIAAP